MKARQSRFRLTRRQLSILPLLAEGCSNKEIAERLGVSSETIKHHLRWIYIKTGTNNRTQAAVWYVKKEK